ncbi:uncharacterized protein ACNFOS_013292 [Eudromia elegans]
MEGRHGAECDRISETTSILEDEEEEEEEETVDAEEAEELTNSLKDLIQNEDVKPKLQYIMTNPSFSMVTVQSEDSGITWETSSSRCSTPWTSEASATSDLYSMESSLVGSPPGKVIFIMDEGKIIRKRKRRPSSRMMMPTNLKGGQGNKKCDFSGMQRQEPRTVLVDVQGSVLNVKQMEAQDTDEEMLEDKDLENIAGEPVKRAPIRSIFRESKMRKIGPILGGPVKSRIQLFNSIFGGTEPPPETLEKTTIQRSGSISGESEHFLETSVRERLQKFSSFSEGIHPKPYQKARSRNLDTPSERRRELRRQLSSQTNQNYLSAMQSLKKRLLSEDDISSKTVKPVQMKDKPRTFSNSGAEITLQGEERKGRRALAKTPSEVLGWALESELPEEAAKQQSYPRSSVAEGAVTQSSAALLLDPGDKPEKQTLLLPARTPNQKPDALWLTAPTLLEELKEREVQPPSAPTDSAEELDGQALLPASVLEHPEKEIQKSVIQSHLPSALSAKSKYSLLSEATQEGVTPPSPKIEKEKQKTLVQETPNLCLEKQSIQTRSVITQPESEKQYSPRLVPEAEGQEIKPYSPIPEKIESKYFGISYPVHAETQKFSPVTTAGLDHNISFPEQNKQTESVQLETEHAGFSGTTEVTEESERPQMEPEYPDFSFSREEIEDSESAQPEMEHPDFSYSTEEMMELESTQLEMEHPDFSYSREEMAESEGAQPETEHPDFFFSRKQKEELQSPPLRMEHTDLHSREERVTSEGAQLDTEHADFSFPREEREELQSAPLGKEHSKAFSHSKEEMVEWEGVQRHREHPGFSYAREKMVESEGAHLETEYPDFSSSRKEIEKWELGTKRVDSSREESEELQSALLGMEHADLSHSREEILASEGSQLDMEHPTLPCLREEVMELVSAQLDTEHPAFSYSKEKAEELGNAKLKKEHPTLSYSKKEMEELGSAQLEKEHPAFLYSRGEMVEMRNTQVETKHMEFSYSREETGKQKSVPLELENPKLSYSYKEAEQQEAAQLILDPSCLSGSMEKGEKGKTTGPGLVCASDGPDSPGRAETQQTGYLGSEHSHLSYPANKRKLQQMAQVDLDDSHLSDIHVKGEHLQPVQQDSQYGDELYSLGEAGEGETTQLQSEHLDSSYSPVKERQGRTSQLTLQQADASYSPGRTEQQEMLLPKSEQAHSPYSCEEAAQEAVQKDLEGPEPSHFISKVPLASENRHLSFTAGEAMQEGMESGSSDSSHPTGKAKPWEVASSEQKHLSSFSCSAASRQQEGTPLHLSQSDALCSSGKMEQQVVRQKLEQQKTPQQKAAEMELEHSDLSESYGKAEPQEMEQMDLAQAYYCDQGGQQEMAQIEPAHLPLSYSHGQGGKIEMEPAYPEWAFSASTEMQQEIIEQKSKQPNSSHSAGKMEMQEIIPPELEQIFLPFSNERIAPQEIEMRSEYPDLSCSFDTAEQEMFKHLTLPFSSKQCKTAPLAMEHPGFSVDIGETKPGDGVQWESRHPELSYSVGKSQQESEFRSSVETLDEAAQDEAMQVESKYPKLSYSVEQIDQQEASPLDSKYPDLSHTEEQAALESKLKHQDLPKNFEQTDLSLPIDKPDYEMAQLEMEHVDVIYPPDKREVQQGVQLELEQTGLTYSFGKTELKTVEPEMEHPDSALSVGAVEEEAAAQMKLRQPGMSYSVSETGALQTAQLKPKHPSLAYFTDQVQESTQPRVAQPGVSHAHDKTEPCPSTQLELACMDLSSSADKAERPGRSHIVLGHPDTSHSVSAAEHPQAAILGSADVFSDNEKAERKGRSEPELKHPDLTYSVDKTQPQVTTQLSLGKPDLSSLPSKAEQPPVAQERPERLGFVHSSSKAGQQEKAQPGLEHPQLSYSVHQPEQKAAYEKSNRSDLSYAIGKLEHHKVIQTEAEQMDLSRPIGEMQQAQIAQLDLGYPDLSYSIGTGQQWEKVQPELQQPSVFSSSHVKEQQRERVRMQSGHHDLQRSLEEAAGLQTSQVKCEYADLLFSVGTAGPHAMTQLELKEHNLLHSCVKTKRSQAAPLESEYPDISNSLSKVEHPDLSCSVSKEKQIARLEFKLQPALPCSPTKAEQPSRAQMEVEAKEFLHSSGRTEQQERAEQVLEHPDLSYSQVNLEQPILSSSLGKAEQEAAQTAFLHSHVLCSTGKAEQFQTEQPESRCLGKAETHGKKQPELLYSYGEMEQPHMELEQAEVSRFAGEVEQRESMHPQLQCANLQYAVSETEQPETPSGSYAFGRTEEYKTAQLEPEQSDLSSSTDKVEQQETALLRAGHSERQDSEVAASLTTHLETEQQDLSFSAQGAESWKIQPYSSLPEQSESVPLGVSHSVSEIKMGGSQKSSPVTAGLSPKHSDLSYTHCKTQQSEMAQPQSGFFFEKNTKIDAHSTVAVQSETKPPVLPETGKEQTSRYFHTTTQLESEKLSPSYSTDKAEALENQVYLTVPSKLESEPSVPFYSVDETYQQETPSYSKAASEYLVPTYSLAEEDKQSTKSFIPQTAPSEYKHIITQHDETELSQIQLYSSKRARSKTEQSDSMCVRHTPDQGKQGAQDQLLDTEYLSSKQLKIPPKFTAERYKQEMQPDVQQVTKLVTAESKAAAEGSQQAVSSDSFVPSHMLPEKSVSQIFTDEEKENIPLSVSGIVGMLGKQSKIISSSHNEENDRHEIQPYFTDQKFTSLGAVTSDVIYGTVTHKPQLFSGKGDSFSSAKSISCVSSDEKRNPDVPSSSFGLATQLAEEVKNHSISPIRAAEVDKQGIEFSPNEASAFGSKQIPDENCKEHPLHGTVKNKPGIFRVSDAASHEISHRLSSETSHRIQRHDLKSLERDNPGAEKLLKKETSIGNPTEMEAVQYPDVDQVHKVSEHHLGRKEVETEHVRAVEDNQHAPEPTEQSDLFNIISEGYEILNIHAPMHISSVDQEESNHMPDKLEYLETNPLFKRKLADDGHRVLASETTVETSESSGQENPGSENHKVEELVKDATTEEAGETEMDESTLPEPKNNTVLDPNNGTADMDYFEKYTLIDDRSPIKPTFERLSSLVPVTENSKELAEEDPSFKESSEANTLEEDFSLPEDLDEAFYGTIKGESLDSYASVSKLLLAQKSIEISSKKVMNVEDEQKSPGTPLFDSEEGVLERSLFFPTSVAVVNPELLEEPPALSFLYKDLYAEAAGAKTKEESPSDEESGNSNASFPSRNSDTDDGTGIYFEKYILKDEIPVKAPGQPQMDEISKDLPVSGDILHISDKHEQWSGNALDIRIDILPDWGAVEREKVQVDSDIKATICKPTHAIPFGNQVNLSGARSATSEQREEENIPVETTEELPEAASCQECRQRIDYQGAAHQEAAHKQEEQHEIAAVHQTEKYIPHIRTPVEDSEDDQYAQADLSRVPSIQPTEKSDMQREEQCVDICEELAEEMDYDVITQEELLQDEMSSELTHGELLFEDRDSFEHIGDSYEFVEEPEQRTPVELEDSGFVVMYPEKSPASIPQVESPQREPKKAQVDTYCYHCKAPICAIDKLFGEHKDHEVTTLDAAATKMKDQLDKLLMTLEEKSMKIEGFVSEIESLFNSVEENCKKNAELLEKQNEDMLKKVVAQYDEKSENFEEVKKLKMKYLYEQMVNFQQTVDSAKETLKTTVKEMEELDGFVFLNSSKELNKRLLSAMDTILSLERVPSSFSLFERYADSPGKSDQHPLNRMAVLQTPTLIAQEPNSATSTSIAVYWTVNEGDAIDCFQVYCTEEPQANRDQSALVEEYRVMVKESHCLMEDLEPDRCYSVWVMAVNCTGCSLPSEKAIFKTAPAVPAIRAEDCTVCWDTATIRWRPGPRAPPSFTLEYCQQYSPEGEGLRSFAGIKRPELKVSLEPNVNYFFYLRAVNTFGTSEQSEAALISTKGTRFHVLSDTAHPALQLSCDGTVIHLPEKARFTGFPSVLGELLPARGCHYWETVVSACRSYRIGICSEATSQSDVLELNGTSWFMRCCPAQTSFLYRFLHTSELSDVRVTEQPARIGILLDYSGGRLLFFNAERGLVLCTIRHKFTDAAHPAFALEKAGVLTLRTGMELPEFVKQS